MITFLNITTTQVCFLMSIKKCCKNYNEFLKLINLKNEDYNNNLFNVFFR